MTARVLVVDDIPANVKLLEARLSAEYFDVITATNGEEALATCERAKCDIVLLDVMMPDMNGFEVCRRLKAGVTTHHIPVVMVTALDQPSDRVKGLEAGADDFLTKPVSDVALLARAERLRRRIASEPFAIQQGARAVQVTISIGIAGVTDGASAIKRADQALYRAKRDGRNRVVPDAA